MISPIERAQAELGHVAEYPGPRHNQRILQYFGATSLAPFNGDETPWCAAFVNWCLQECWIEGTNAANARSFMDWGEESSGKCGDIVVFWRESPRSWKGHVAFLLDKTDRWVYAVGGNQGNAVSVRHYDAHRVLGYRRVAA